MIDRIARSLTIIPRWAGNTTRPFYVSDHLLIGLAWLKRHEASEETQRAWMLHDTVEAWTSDVPTPYKTSDFKRQENTLLADLGKKFGVPIERILGDDVKACDLDMAAAEDSAVHLNPCGTYGRAADMLVFMIEQNPQQTWADRQAEFKRVWRDLFERVTA